MCSIHLSVFDDQSTFDLIRFVYRVISVGRGRRDGIKARVSVSKRHNFRGQNVRIAFLTMTGHLSVLLALSALVATVYVDARSSAQHYKDLQQLPVTTDSKSYAGGTGTKQYAIPQLNFIASPDIDMMKTATAVDEANFSEMTPTDGYKPEGHETTTNGDQVKTRSDFNMKPQDFAPKVLVVIPFNSRCPNGYVFSGDR